MSSFFRELFSTGRGDGGASGSIDESHFIVPPLVGPSPHGLWEAFMRGRVSELSQLAEDLDSQFGPDSGVREAPLPISAISLRPLTYDDQETWSALRERNADWLSPWDAGNPLSGQDDGRTPGLTYNAWIGNIRKSEEEGAGGAGGRSSASTGTMTSSASFPSEPSTTEPCARGPSATGSPINRPATGISPRPWPSWPIGLSKIRKGPGFIVWKSTFCPKTPDPSGWRRSWGSPAKAFAAGTCMSMGNGGTFFPTLC